MSENVERRDLDADAIATIALTLYSIAVAAGFCRVFSGWEFLDNLVVLAVVGHGAAFVLRRLNTPVWIAFPVTLAALAWTIGVMFYRDTFALFLPTSETWSLFRLELDVASSQFRTAVAPVAFLSGWNALASIGIAAAVLLSDTFAFRAFARAEALVPGGVLFVFVAALGTDRNRIMSTVALVAAGVVTTVALRQHHAPAQSATIGRPAPFAARLLPIAVGSALVVSLVAGVVGPRLPGAGAEPLYDTKGNNGGEVTNVTSPLVDIRSRLTNRSNAELFTVVADGESYWRSSTLAEFDGRIWALPERDLARTDGTFGDRPAGSIEIRQRVEIAALGGVLVPAAADPVDAGAEGDLGDDLRINQESATLVKTGDELAEGNVFDVVSASPRFEPSVLSNATSTDAGDPIYLELPADFPASIRDTALEVTAGAGTSYDAALALQNWMRSEFQYSLEVQEGHGNNEIESFLRNRVGYCEQFAGSYAAMMRSIGIPARVAVGFTPGSNDGTGTYSVVGRNAHAWPEVWFDDIGWVPFEPTPGRGAPNAQEYTGVDQQQDEGPGTPDGPPATATPTTTPAPVAGENGAPVPTTTPPSPTPIPGAAQPNDSESATDIGSPRDVPWKPLAALTLIGLLLATPAAVRRLRRAAIASPQDQLTALWIRATEALGAVGVASRRDHTPTETARATDAAFPLAARPMRSLAEVVTEATFAPDGDDRLGLEGVLGTSTLQSATSWCRQIEHAVADSVGPLGRIRRYFTVWR